jgi:hypothetical protein
LLLKAVVHTRLPAVLLLLQACRPTLAARRSLAHEWKMFKDLSLLANDFQAARSHFLQVRLTEHNQVGRLCTVRVLPHV